MADLNDDYYACGDYSDEDEVAISSEDDEIDLSVNKNGRIDLDYMRTRKASASDRECNAEDNGEDEFESEMSKELDETVRKAAEDAGLVDKMNKTYDDVYFDSDDEDTNSQETVSQRQICSDEQLLYDPKQDYYDQRWIDGVRRRYQNSEANSSMSLNAVKQVNSKTPVALPNSDAVLNCPACFAVICLDCQRHATYHNQYRAMFVMNCSVIQSKTLTYKAVGKKKELKDEIEIYNPVQCDECGTQVAVFDKEEVYHFYNIVASH